MTQRIAVEKPWGRIDIPAAFGVSPGERIGEIWYPGHDDHPLMIKYLFTSERLSIQVHPNDAQARARGLPFGKDECWYILSAEPDAKIAIGFNDAYRAEDVQAGAVSGAIEQMVDWRPVRAGEFIYVPAGTIHAIGGGISLIEIQRNVDVTYRLYDYGRPRPLHLEDGLAVTSYLPYDTAQHFAVDPTASGLLINGPYFSVYHMVGNGTTPLRDDSFLTPLSGMITVDGMAVHPGDVVPVRANSNIIASGDARALLAWPQGQAV